MKKSDFLMGMLLTLGLFCACSSDDEMSNSFEGQSPTEQNESEKGEVIQGTSDETVEFQLQNEEGIECYEFNEGDNIIFCLKFKNDLDEDAYVPRFCESIGWDGFRVYSIDGVDMGKPWDEIITNFRGRDFIEAHSSVIILCPWFDIPALYWNGHEHYYSGMYYKKEEKLPLPKGEYYSRFDIKIKDKTIVCNRNFKII